MVRPREHSDLHFSRPVDESGLLNMLIQNDQNAFRILYDLYSPRIYSRLLKLVKSEDLAEDLLQQTFINLWNHRHTLDTQKSLRGYLFTIAGNLTLNTWRKARRDKALMEKLQAAATELHSQTEEWLQKKENAIQIRRAIDALPPQRKKIFKLCKLEEKSYAEVGKMLGISVSTINDHIVKAVRSIKEQLLQEGNLSGFLLIIFLWQ